MLDRLIAEPGDDHHPVALFGRAMSGIESRLYEDRRGAGITHTGIGLALGVATGMVVRSTTIATAIAVAGRSLALAGGAVEAALRADDLETARSLLPALVGRDPDELDRTEITRAVVESLAENTVDAIVAPAFWGAVGGAPGALGYRAVNTLDAMVGHHSARYENYGWASARLDDLVAFVPARLTALLVLAVRPRHAREVRDAVRNQAPSHPSPNSGVAEAAFAAALGLRLGGVNRYGDHVESRPTLGLGHPPETNDIGRAVRLSLDVGWALTGLLATAAFAMNRRWR